MIKQYQPLKYYISRIKSEEIARDAPLDDMIRVHCQELAIAEGIIIIHPNWWGMPPAILKGWVDRVIRPGVAYEFLEGDSGRSAPWTAPGQAGNRLQYLQHPSREGAKRLWRSSADHLEELHLRIMRHHRLSPQDLLRGSDQHTWAACRLAGRCPGDS